MGSETEPAKLLLPYLQRADELQKHEPLVAYYCRLYAMERGLQIPQKERTKTTNSLLISLMNQLEKDKKSLKLGPEDNLYLEGFASNVFAKADKQDRAGRADLNTAKTFYAASIFFEVLNQFGELQPDLEQKQKYSVWKAAEIRKALKEGRKPEPGPPGGDKDAAPSVNTTNSYDLSPSQSFVSRQQSGEASPKPVDKPSSTEDLSRSESFSAIHPGDHISPQNTQKFNAHVPTQPPYSAPPQSHYSPPPQSHYSTPSHPSADYSSNDAYNLPSNDKPDDSAYPKTYHQPPYTIEQQHVPQNYYSAENATAPYSYPNFQSYPSFQDSTLPSIPTHHPSFYHGSDAAAAGTAAMYSSPPASISNYPQQTQYHAGTEIGNQVAPPAPAVDPYKYDSSYQPPAEKIAEAHKAARFAVGALAFDDISVAVDHLKRALELLVNPSAKTN